MASRKRTIVRVEGGRQLRATLKAAGDDLDDLKAAHGHAAEVVVPRARSGAPVGETGRLAASVRGSGTKQGAFIRAGNAGLRYAGVQEWGWPSRHIPAQPFVVPAARETQPVWYEAYRTEVQAIVDRVKGV